MAAINDLTRQIPDSALRARLEQEFDRMSKNKNLALSLRYIFRNVHLFMVFLSAAAVP